MYKLLTFLADSESNNVDEKFVFLKKMLIFACYGESFFKQVLFIDMLVSKTDIGNEELQKTDTKVTPKGIY